MAKGIYIGRPGDHVNQRLANLVIDEQLPIWDKKDLRKYQKIYPTSKAWILLESEFDFSIPQQLTPSIEAKINPIDDGRQETITPRPSQIGSVPPMRQETITPRPAQIGSIPPMRQITPDPANALCSIPPTKAPLVQIPPVQAPLIPAHPIQVPTAQVLPIQVSLVQVLPIPAATIQAPLSIPLAPSLPAKHSHGQPEMYTEQVKIVLNKLDIFTANAQVSASGKKEIQGLSEKDVFKVVTPDKVVIPEKVPSSTQVFNSRFVDETKDPCSDKAYEKSRLIVYVYNDKKKNIVLEHSSNIPGVSQGLRDIIQVYVEIASDLYPDFYIRPLPKLISQLSALSESIFKVMRPLYDKPEVDNHQFAIYHLHYKEDNLADVMTNASPNLALEGMISTGKATIRLEGWVKR